MSDEDMPDTSLVVSQRPASIESKRLLVPLVTTALDLHFFAPESFPQIWSRGQFDVV
jgi:hypothetical protein